MRRRDFITVLGGTAAAGALSGRAVAQAVPSIFQIGIVSPAASKSTLLFDTFRARLKELGYVEDRNIVIEFRLAAGAPEKVPALAADLVRQPVDVLVADGAHVIGVLQGLTKTIPTVGIIGVDPSPPALFPASPGRAETLRGSRRSRSNFTLNVSRCSRRQFRASCALPFSLTVPKTHRGYCSSPWNRARQS